MISHADMHDAIKRIANTSDGRLLRRYLQLVVNELSGVTDLSALQAHHGRRSFAHELKRLLEEGLTDSERESGGSGGTVDPDEPVAGARQRPVDRVRRGLERRVPADPDAT